MEKKYIEHEKVIEVIKNFAKGAISDGKKALDPVDDILLLCSAVDMIPAADVAEVVRCEECRHFLSREEICDEDQPEGCGCCAYPLHYMQSTEGCSFGERRKGAE